MQQMRLLSWHANFMMLTCAKDGFSVLARHGAADHCHSSAYLQDFAVKTDCCALI
jgi:hypothetical protein